MRFLSVIFKVSNFLLAIFFALHTSASRLNGLTTNCVQGFYLGGFYGEKVY